VSYFYAVVFGGNVSRRFSYAALALFVSLAIPRVALAQTSGPILPDDPYVLIAITIGAVLVLMIVGGLILAFFAGFFTRFFAKNVPSAAAQAAFDKQQAAALEAERGRPRRPVHISPTLEPFVIAVGGFLVVFALASIFVTPPAQKTEAAGATTPAAASGLPVSGDFSKIVAALPKGNADNGAKLFTSMGCSGCHGQQKDQRIVGPSFYGLWGRAATIKPGYGSAEFIYESIVNPNAYVEKGFQPNLMPATFSKQLSQQDMADILAWIERDHNEK
jgi:cytochrome c2